jgi:filamentous hemagglutinin family protein
MVNNLMQAIQSFWKAALTLMICQLCQRPVLANPAGGVVTQGAATFNTAGSTFTINQSSANASINWSSFNIGAGETTTFNQPSATSVTWNQINGGNPSQIMGNLNANGYIILQNQNGFAVGGSAVINAHGLVMTTSPTPAPNLDSGGAWTFSALPPTAKIVNYGQINLTGGGSGYLIASDIENNDTISAPNGHIGLYAGQKVLVSLSPDGRGLSAEVTLPQGSVDNEGQLVADGGTIAAQAQMVNQNGLVQANSVKTVNGEIQLVASDTASLGANSIISAQGDSVGASAGGNVIIKAANVFADQAGSTIEISGGAQGGNGGRVEISAPTVNPLQSQILGAAAKGYAGGQLQIDSSDVTLDNTYISLLNNELSSSGGGLSEVDVTADNDIELTTLWTIPGSTSGSKLINLTAGNNITLDDGTGIQGGQNISLKLTAGTGFVPTAGQPIPVAGNDGIYLTGGATLQTQNGDIDLWAANEVQVGWQGSENVGLVNTGQGSVTTAAGGNIKVTAVFGDVNTGSNPQGFVYNAQKAPYYTIYSTPGGIATAAGGNVNINAGGNVYSYVPSGSDPVTTAPDAGTGAFGATPGDVTITAGGNIYGHYVLADGTGTITAGGDVGSVANAFALSLIDGNWNVNAKQGSIYLQEVRNPNGVFNNHAPGVGSPPNLVWQHFFNYGADASVNLNASIGVDLTDLNLPRLSTAANLPAIYPPILNISAGSGGVTMEGNVTLFPSPDQNLNIVTINGGSLSAPFSTGVNLELIMSDSAQSRWVAQNGTFNLYDHGPLSAEPTGWNPVVLNISGNLENLDLFTTKETKITVGGNMIDCNFSGQNLHASDATSITVAGQIYNQSALSFVNGIDIKKFQANVLPIGLDDSWNDIFFLALDPTLLANFAQKLIANRIDPATATFDEIIQSSSLFGVTISHNQLVQDVSQNFVYDPGTGRLGFNGRMPQNIWLDLSQPLTVLQLVNGAPVFDPQTGQFKTETINWVPPSQLQTLYTTSQTAPQSQQIGYELGGPGQFNITAGSIDLGSTFGIISSYVSDFQTEGLGRFENLVSVTPVGATVNVKIAGDLTMFTSAIAALGSGNVNVNSASGSLELGSADLIGLPVPALTTGIFTAGGGDITVKAQGDINVDGSRIATFNGGNIFIESFAGSVNAGAGVDVQNTVLVFYVNASGIPAYDKEGVLGSGIETLTLSPPSATDIKDGIQLPPGAAEVPGDITVITPRGDIIANNGGILQEALNGNVSAGPVINLIAGTLPRDILGTPDYSPGYVGNIDVQNSGVIGGAVNATANGNINGIIISRQNSNINAAQNFNGLDLAGGIAEVSAGNGVTGTIAGIGGASVTGGDVTAEVLSQNASVNGGAAQSTFGSSANATSTSQSAANATSADNKQQTTIADTSDDDEKKKKRLPVLQKVKRVTVLLSAVAPH